MNKKENCKHFISFHFHFIFSLRSFEIRNGMNGEEEAKFKGKLMWNADGSKNRYR